MYRHRNRPKYSESELKIVYPQPHVHTKWEDHIHRVDRTIQVGLDFIGTGNCEYYMADLSCGDGAIVNAIDDFQCCATKFLGDFAPGYELQGPIEETIDQIPYVDLFVLSETLEHLDDPEGALRKIRAKADRLLMSTPWCQWVDQNPEHYWSWDDQAIREILADTGWTPKSYENYYTGLGYHYQIWTAE